MNLDKTIAEMTLEDLREFLMDSFETFVLYAKNTDPSVAEEGSTLSLVNGGLWDRVGRIECIKDDMQNEREANQMYNMGAYMDQVFGDYDPEDFDEFDED